MVKSNISKKPTFESGLHAKSANSNRQMDMLNPVWHGTGHFYPFVIVRSDIVSLIFIKNFQTFLEVKIYINLFNLTP